MALLCWGVAQGCVSQRKRKGQLLLILQGTGGAQHPSLQFCASKSIIEGESSLFLHINKDEACKKLLTKKQQKIFQKQFYVKVMFAWDAWVRVEPYIHGTTQYPLYPGYNHTNLY